MMSERMKIRWTALLLVAVMLMSLCGSAGAVKYPYTTISMDDVNLRKTTSTSSVVLKRISAGDEVTIEGVSGSYYKVTFDGKTGYAMKKYIDGTDPSPDPTPDASVHRNPPLAVTSYPYDTTTAGRVKLRKKAQTDGEVIRTLFEGTIVTVLSLTDNGFAKVKYEETTGYLLTDYVNLANIPGPTATPGPTAVPGSEKYTAVKKGDTGIVVTALQNVLIELGYLEGTADGKFGPQTEKALMLLQKRNGLTQDGIASQELQLLLYEGTPKDKNSYRQYVKTLPPIAGATIKLNSIGDAVKTLQTRLKELGYYTGAISGTCDEDTVAAISAFEAKNNLTQDGVADATDQNLLYGLSAISAAVVVTPTPSPTPQVPNGTVRAGDTGNDAKLVQTRLQVLGYYTGKISGTFNTASVEALKAFQKANGLKQDGVCGTQTRAVMFAEHPVYAVPTAIPVTVTTAPSTVVTTYPPITQENVVVIKAGSRGTEVLRLQTRLQELGYYSSRLDGVYLTDDINAVRAFQKANKLTVDGKAGFNTQSLLYSAAAVSSAANTTNSTTLRYGDSGTEVIALQTRLIELGYLAGAADGKFGSATRKALVAFQRANNLTRDGVAGSATLAALSSTSATDNKVSYSYGSLRVGSTNDAVKELQNRLIALGYLTGKADGKFGTQTNLALIAFQKANGLTADGIAGNATIRKINSTSIVTASGAATGTTTTTTAAAPTVTTATISAANVRYANWYTEVRAKARSYPNVTIYDFTTGISWQVNIFSNGAHADAEPLTATDTANMNRAFGNKTTWTPKAVWVVFSDGTIYMASTHNTPHDTSHNTSNNFDGHLCIHFPRTQAQVEAIGPYATSHQKAIDLGWEATQRRAGR